MTQQELIENYIDTIPYNLNNKNQLVLAYLLIEDMIYSLDFTDYKKEQNNLITINELIKEVLENEN